MKRLEWAVEWITRLIPQVKNMSKTIEDLSAKFDAYKSATDKKIADLQSQVPTLDEVKALEDKIDAATAAVSQ